MFKNSVKSWKHQTGGQWPGVYVCVLQTLNCLRKHHFDTDFNLTRQTLCIWSRVSSFSKLSCHHFKLIKQIIIEQDNVYTLPAESEGMSFLPPFTSVSYYNQSISIQQHEFSSPDRKQINC